MNMQAIINTNNFNKHIWLQIFLGWFQELFVAGLLQVIKSLGVVLYNWHTYTKQICNYKHTKSTVINTRKMEETRFPLQAKGLSIHIYIIERMCNTHTYLYNTCTQTCKHTCTTLANMQCTIKHDKQNMQHLQTHLHYYYYYYYYYYYEYDYYYYYYYYYYY